MVVRWGDGSNRNRAFHTRADATNSRPVTNALRCVDAGSAEDLKTAGIRQVAIEWV